MPDRVAVIDFETNGSGPDARATEIALVRVDEGSITERFSSLMHTGADIPPFIEQLTGITSAMLETAPSAREVMTDAHALSQGCVLVAHNASFDRGFWVNELRRAGVDASATPFLCTVRLGRKLLPAAPNHKLGTLARYLDLPSQGRAHRAMADASTTALLWQVLVRKASEVCEFAVDADLLLHLQAQPVERWPRLAQRVQKVRREKAAQAAQMEIAC